MKAKLLKRDYLVVGLVAFLYFLLLCSKDHTFLFFSGDSGDWLASSIWWMVPQPYGSPLFITLGHLLNSLPLPDLVLKMTIGLSVIPASITVATTYLITKKLTNYKIAIVCALVLMGSAIYLTQATILEEFALSSMFVTLAFYFYIRGKKKLTILMLTLGSAVQIIVVLISALWLILHIREFKQWWRTFWIYGVFGPLPYGLILILMYLPTPRLLSGSLSLAGINNYLGATGTLGSMSLFEAPARLANFIEIFSVSLGLALIPLFMSFRGLIKQGKYILVAVVSILFVLWVYLTDSDPGTWHFLPIIYPLIMVLVALGLQKIPPINTKIVAYGACALILINGIFLNANVLANQNPLAQKYEQELQNLPDGSYVVANSGGEYGLDNYYIMASGKDIRPIFIDGDIANLNDFSTEFGVKYTNQLSDYLVSVQGLNEQVAIQQIQSMIKDKAERAMSERYKAYLQWMNEKYGLQGNSTVQQVRWLLSQKADVYLVLPCVTPYWQNIFQIEFATKKLTDGYWINQGGDLLKVDEYSIYYDSDLARIVGVND